MIEGNVGVNRRFTVRGFKDKFQDFDIYAGSISRSGHWLVNAVVADNEVFILFSFDVSQAFAKGFTFEEFSKFTGVECRVVEFDVPKPDLDCFKQLDGL